MPRHQKPADLNLQQGKNGSENGIQPGPHSSPMNLHGVDLGSFGGGFEDNVAAGLTPLPKDRANLPQSPPGSPRNHNREPSKGGFLSGLKNRGKTSPDQELKKDTRNGKNESKDTRPGTGSMRTIYHLKNNPGSTPELSIVGSQENVHKDSSEGEKPALPVRPQPTPQHSQDSTTSRRKEGGKLINRVRRTGSMRRGSNSNSSRPTINGKDSFDQRIPNTAPLQSDWPGSDARMKGKANEDRRGKSEERRANAVDSQENLSSSYPSQNTKSSSLRSDSRSTHNQKEKTEKKSLFSGIRTGVNRALGRNQSSHGGKDVPDSEYVLQVINLPLVEQTRLTRISKDLNQCRDKTEYWMPSLPWRCIDFLNTRCEQEGLYRVPGSGPQVKHWQRRFDQQLDIDLLEEDVADTNEIASMLKAWFRELPTEIMPKHLQNSLAADLEKQNPNYKNVGQEAPQLLRDALSELPPFNYYLLFAITCHLSLLLTNKDLNKMDLNNLSVCVGPCLYLDRWLFNYLVGDWRHCWQGCFTEKEFLNVERMVAEGHDPNDLPERKYGDGDSVGNSAWGSTVDDYNDRAISSGSSKQTSSFDTRSLNHKEDARPMTYLPAGAKMGNGSYGLGIDQDMQRPATAQGGPPSEGMTGLRQEPAVTNKSRSNSTTPRVGHSRSRSDLPPTPVKTNADFGFPIRPPSRPASRSSQRRG